MSASSDRKSDLFTPGCDPAKALLVARIAARRGDYFRTQAYALTENSGGAASESLIWREARCTDAARNLWKVEELKSVEVITRSGEPLSAERIFGIHRDVCLFDALYSCARFEVYADSTIGPAAEKPSLAELGHTHVEAFAKREGIIYDIETGLPVPVANGQRLDGGTFAADSRAIIKAAEGNLLPAENLRPAGIVGDLVGGARPASTLPATVAEAMREMHTPNKGAAADTLKTEKNRKTLRTISSDIAHYRKFVVERSADGFRKKHDPEASGLMPFALITGTATTGLGAVAGSTALAAAGKGSIFLTLMSGGFSLLALGLGGFMFLCAALVFADKRPQLMQKLMQWEFKRNAGKIPPGPLRDSLDNLAAEIDLAVKAMMVRQYYRDHIRTNGFGSKRKVKSATKAFVKACHAQKWENGEEKIIVLLSQLQDDIDNKDLDNTLKNRIIEKMDLFEAYLKDLEKAGPGDLAALPPPQLPPGQTPALPRP